jgi:hypothetical protein
MKNSSRIKAGKRSGNPGYRTASPWRYQQAKQVAKNKSQIKNRP